MQVIYCDCFSGISGDMFLAGLVDAGLPVRVLQEQLAALSLDEPFRIEVQKVHKGAFLASLLHFQFEAAQSRTHRHLSDIQALIQASRLPDTVQQKSLAIFQKLGEAEAKVHGIPIEEVHFHEVGALDSILDVVGAAIGLEFFNVNRLYASALPMGSGQTGSDHGALPLPAPATLELLRIARAPVVPSPARMEMVTPTGAAILASLATFEQPFMTITGVGIGAGQRDLAWPNILRLVLGDDDATRNDGVVLMETNIDDMNPQVFGYVLNHLFSNGALDVFFTPIFMKKNRPATKLSLLARRSDEQKLARILLEETTTFGLRVQPVVRYEAQRAFHTVSTEYGPIPVKLKILDGTAVQAIPEYEACASLAEEKGVTLLQVYSAALSAGKAWLDSHPALDQVEPDRSDHPHPHVHQ